MGSFNTTCFVTQQTISTEDRAVIFPIIQQSTYNPVELSLQMNDRVEQHSTFGYSSSNCYPTAFWGFSGPMIKGTYNDYGRFKLDEDDSNIKNIIGFFNNVYESLYKVEEGENKSHEIGFDFKAIYNPQTTYTNQTILDIWEKLWEVSDECRLFKRNYKGQPASIAFAVMSEHTYEYLVDMVSKYKGWSGESYEQKSYLFSYMNEKLKEIKEIFPEFDTEKTGRFLGSKVASLEGFRIGEQEGANISGLYRNNYKEIDKIFSSFFKKNAHVEAIDTDLVEQVFNVVKDNINHRYVLTGLTSLNVKLSPMVYASQDYSNELGNEYLKMLKVVNKKINMDIKSKYGEDEEVKPKKRKVKP